MNSGCAMPTIDEIMKLLAEAKRQADAMGEINLSFHIGTALLAAQDVALGQTSKRPRR